MPQENSQIVFRYGTQSQYDNLVTKNINTIYIITDTHKIYIGDSLYGGSGQESSSFSNGELLQIRTLLEAFGRGQLRAGQTENELYYFIGELQETSPETGQYEEEASSN